MAIGIYAGSTVNNMTILPSPVSIKPSNELIWSENTGRAQSGTNKAQMIGDVIAEKDTYNIQWGIITQAEFATIKSKLTKGFFYFGLGTSLANAQASAIKVYRSNITGTLLPIGNDVYYKDVAVDVIEQ